MFNLTAQCPAAAPWCLSHQGTNIFGPRIRRRLNGGDDHDLLFFNHGDDWESLGPYLDVPVTRVGNLIIL